MTDFNDILIIDFIRSLDLVKLAMVVFPVVLYLCAYSLSARLFTRWLGKSSEFLSHLHINAYFFGTFLTLLLCLASVGMFYNDDPVANLAQRAAQLIPPAIAAILGIFLLLSIFRYLQLYRWVVCDTWWRAGAVVLLNAVFWTVIWIAFGSFMIGLVVSGAYRL